jgi:palmitoyltransferase
MSASPPASAAALDLGAAAGAPSSSGASAGLAPGAAISRPTTPATIHSAAQRGDLALIQHLISTGRATANDRDEEGITPLHWAAINAHTPVCRFLLEHGAEVDALGGDLVASPLQWAARNGHLYVMHLLLCAGADPTLSDAQGFNAMHLTVHSSAVMPLLLLLQHTAFSTFSSLDSADSQGHTPLMWAAYQGDALSLDLLLAHGSDVHRRDATGLTPMHWAVVKGNRLCIRKLAGTGSDLWAREEGGKTPREMAVELKSLGAYKKALADVGLEEDGRRKYRPLAEVSCILQLPGAATRADDLSCSVLRGKPSWCCPSSPSASCSSR